MINFDELNDRKRALIWKNQLERLEEENGISVSARAQNFLQFEEMRDVQWNGWEIRNALHMAISLAMQEQRPRPTTGFHLDLKPLERRHFRRVLQAWQARAIELA